MMATEFPYTITHDKNGRGEPVSFKSVGRFMSIATDEEVQAFKAYEELKAKSLDAAPSAPVAAAPAQPKHNKK
jgi:hypothetical protein